MLESQTTSKPTLIDQTKSTLQGRGNAVVTTMQGELGQYLDRLKAEQGKKPDTLFHASEHFLVVYDAVGKALGDSRLWLDTHPSALAEYLEGKLRDAQERFHTNLPVNTFQVVRVGKPGMFLGKVFEGYHKGDQEGLTRFSRRWNHARFSTVYAIDYGTSNEPSFYQNAIHEAIGHGYIEPQLFLGSKDKKDLRFLHEGFVTYLTDVATGINPHEQLTQRIVRTAEYMLTDPKGNWIPDYKSQEQAEVLLEQAKDGQGFELSDLFLLRGKKSDVTKRGLKTNNYYYRGNSFVKYFLDTYGLSKFKYFVAQISRDNFFDLLTAVTGNSIQEIEEGWRQEVLENNFVSNQPIDDQDETDITRKSQIKMLYQKICRREPVEVLYAY